MLELALVPLGNQGQQYLTDYLSQGEGLTQALLEIVKAHSDNVSAVLPRDVLTHRAIEFDRGGIMPMAKSVEWLSNRLVALASARPGILIIQDLWAKADDLKYDTHPSLRIKDGMIYRIAPSVSITMLNITRIFNLINSYPLLGAYIADADESTILNLDSWEDRVKDSVLEVFVRAYDQEGFLIWCRPN